MTLDRDRCSLSELVGAVEDDVRPLADQARVRLEVAPVPDVALYLDRSLFRRCLENLLTNAVKFSPAGGVIELTGCAHGGVVTIDVADEGPGVAEEQRERIFEPFRIGEMHRGVPQLGLGLAFCRMVVNAHDGRIAALPRDGQGSIFRVTLARDVAEGAG